MRLLTILALLAAMTAAGSAWANHDGRDFNATLLPAPGGPEDGFGRLKFRQPRDDEQIAFLGVKVRRLLPDQDYYFQRATDPVVDDVCTGTNWLTLGHGLVPAPIQTDRNGKGRVLLWRDLSAIPEGTEFDIHFRVIDAVTSAVVLQSACHQFTVRR